MVTFLSRLSYFVQIPVTIVFQWYSIAEDLYSQLIADCKGEILATDKNSNF